MTYTVKTYGIAVFIACLACSAFGYWLGTPKKIIHEDTTSIYSRKFDTPASWSIRLVRFDAAQGRRVDTILVIDRDQDKITFVDHLVTAGDTGISEPVFEFDEWVHVHGPVIKSR